MIGLLCREFNCTPTEAEHELRNNPWVFDVILAEQYRQAYVDVEEWESLAPDQRVGRDPPAGRMVKRVYDNKRRVLRDMTAERKAALKAKGRA